MVSELIEKYLWIIRRFEKAGLGGLSLEDILSGWERRWGSPYSRSSFNNHRRAIEEIFGIRIECDRRTNRYLVRYSGDISDESSSLSWIVNTFTVNSLLRLGKERLSGRVSVEDIPSGQKFLAPIMDAMLEGRKLELEYRKYTSDIAERVRVRPYAVKEHEKRWYLVAYCEERAALRVYGLDRIVSIGDAEGTFRLPEDFDVDSLFASCFGVYLSGADRKPEEILIQSTLREARYLRDLKLHPSQKELVTENPATALFSVRLVPDDNFIMELCRHGQRIEVLSPQSVRDAVAEELRTAAAQYL